MAQLKQSLAEFWSLRDARERTLLLIAAAVVLLAMIYALFIAPALTGRETLRKKLPALREQVVQMQALSKEAASYAEQSPPTAVTLTKELIESALARHNLKAQSITLSGDMTQVQLTEASFSSTLSWLQEMQKTALISVSDANIVALAQPDKVNVKITLQQHRQL